MTLVTIPPLLASYVALCALLFVKHYLGDAQFQTRWQVMYKGIYGHPAGLIHTGIHVGLTVLFVGVWYLLPAPYSGVFDAHLLLLALALEWLVHYHVDWFKAKYLDKLGWQSFKQDKAGKELLTIHDSRFFLALIGDQVIHFITYLVMGLILLRNMY